MANGDPLLIGHKSESSSVTWLVGKPGPRFGGFSLFRAGDDPISEVEQRVDGIVGVGSAPPYTLDGGAGVVGLGAIPAGTGVVGVGGTVAGVGVFGLGGNMHSVPEVGPIAPAGAGVIGHSVASQNGTQDTSPGVFGIGDANDGVLGISGATGFHGVRGLNSQQQGSAVGVLGQTFSPQGIAIVGIAASGGIGTVGFGKVGIAGAGPTAGFFIGDVKIKGDLICTGTKSASISYGDGTMRRLYCIESPESWFEDFGEATLKHGKARVKLAADFKKCVGSGTFHVFLTPLGDCNGLFVARRGAGAFEVRELGGGTRTLKFSYRVVLKRKGTEGKRLEKVELPDAPELPSKKALAAMAAADQRLTSFVRTAGGEHLKRGGRAPAAKRARKQR